MNSRTWRPLVASLLIPAQAGWSINPAFAQEAPPPAAQGVADVVNLKDGSLFRGTIIELVPNDHVDMLLANGQTRRFAMSDVAYAGAAAAQPSPSAAAATPAPRTAPAPTPPEPMIAVRAAREEVRFEANQPDVQFLMRVGQAELSAVGYSWRGGMLTMSGQSRDYAIICTAPCDGQLPDGVHRLALSWHGGKAVEPTDPVHLQGPATLRGRYESHAGTRVAGWLVFGLSLAGGTLLAATSARTTESCDVDGFCSPNTQINTTQFGLGIGIMVLGGIVGLVLGLTRDTAAIEVVPRAAE